MKIRDSGVLIAAVLLASLVGMSLTLIYIGENPEVVRKNPYTSNDAARDKAEHLYKHHGIVDEQWKQ